MPPEQENYPEVPLNELDMEGCLGHMYNNYLRWSEVVKVTLIINTQRVFHAFLQTKFKLQHGAVLWRKFTFSSALLPELLRS